jgi:predicted nucleic acid-binding protein
VASAIRILKTAVESATNHHFWNDDLPLSVLSVRWSRGMGQKQITDAYLLALAIHHRGCLVTFDSRIRTLAGEGNMEGEALLILKP